MRGRDIVFVRALATGTGRFLEKVVNLISLTGVNLISQESEKK